MQTSSRPLLVLSAIGAALVVAACNKPPVVEAPATAQVPPVSMSASSAVDNPSQATTSVAGATPEDIDITSRVKTALLGDDTVKPFDINVVTLKGDVRLTGIVDNQAQIDQALKLARAVSGVHSIHDELAVKK